MAASTELLTEVESHLPSEQLLDGFDKLTSEPIQL